MMMPYNEFIGKLNNPKIRVSIITQISNENLFCSVEINEKQREHITNYLMNVSIYRETIIKNGIHALYFEGHLFVGTEKTI